MPQLVYDFYDLVQVGNVQFCSMDHSESYVMFRG
jgi:hypothetical protein